MSVRMLALAAIVAVVACNGKRAAEPEPVVGEEGIAISLFDGAGGEALIDDRRWVELGEGVGEIHVDRIADTADASSLSFHSLTDPKGTRLLDYGMTGLNRSPELMLDTHIGKDVELVTGTETVAGVLATADPIAVAVRTGDELRIIPRAEIRVIKLAGDVKAGPSLRCVLSTESAGRHLVQLSYRAAQITWQADYSLTFERGTGLTLSSSVSVNNGSRLDIDDAQLALFSGSMGDKNNPAHAVWEGSVDLSPGAQRFGLHPRVDDIPAVERYVYRGAMPDASTRTKDPYYGTSSSAEVIREIAFENSKDNGLGLVLPPGVANITITRDGREERLHGNITERVEPGDEAVVSLGAVPFMYGQRYQQYPGTPSNGVLQETYEFSVTNNGAEKIEVTIIEPIRRPGDATVVRAMPEPKRIGDELHFVMTVPSGGVSRALLHMKYEW
jgi:hypothetical protein